MLRNEFIIISKMLSEARKPNGRWVPKVPEWRPRNGKRSGPQRGGQTTSGESLRAAGREPRTVDCGTPCKRPMSNSGRQLV
ncbi:jg10985 [Pararge aegeria aegeria]|uniref:Jg10985 protein n=1 Tax=Pararge aegeria aegeria TaxID=348720 RepID=A0A8S4SBB3_9NEOP|nr:jg10985 [Pararge aegeria aegeria]